MREIKFRAWDTVNKMWLKITGFETHVSDDNKTASINTGLSGMFHDGDYIGTFQKHGGEQNNVILMQYTGLKDVNGVEIYEGDIVKGYYDEYNSFFDEVNRHEFISEVKYIDNSFKVHRNTLNDEGRIRDYGYVHEWDSELVEVIGNIYENKNLLEEK